MSLSYAGVPLSPPTLEEATWAAGIPFLPGDLRDFSRVGYPGPQLAALGVPAAPGFPAPVPGVLRWPASASRWATAYVCATDSQLAAIRQQVFYAGGYVACPLVFDDGLGRSITASMFMLPARPWTTPGMGGPALWLLTLVDVRYLWWQAAAAVSVTEGTTTWSQLYAALGTALGTTITADTVDAAYLKPAAAFGAGYESLPALLDAAARNAGQRVAVDLDGSVGVYNQASAASLVAQNLGLTNPFRAGGITPLSDDFGALLPSNFSVVFPTASGGSYTGAWTAKSVSLASLALPGLSGVAGNGRTQVLRALQQTAASDSQLNAWAARAAADWVNWLLLGKVSAAYSGVLPWVPDGVHDTEWRHTSAGITTTAQRGPWNEWVAPPVLPSAAAGGSLTVEYDDGTGAVSGVTTLRVPRGLFALSGFSTATLAGLYAGSAFGNMANNGTGIGSVTTVPSGTLASYGAGGVFANSGGSLTWVKAGLYVASFGSDIDVTNIGSGTPTTVGFDVQFDGSLQQGTGNDPEFTRCLTASNGPPFVVRVRTAQLLHVASDGANVGVAVFGAPATYTGGVPILSSTWGAHGYACWGVRVA